MQVNFVVDHGGQQQGPFTLDEILSKVHQGHLDVTDYLYDETTKDWVMLVAYGALSEKLQGRKPTEPVQVVAQTAKEEPVAEEKAVDTEWFVLKGENRFGPFSYFEMVRMLQERSLYEFDYVWNFALASWKRVADISEFRPESIRRLKDNHSGAEELFFRRRHARVEYGASLMIHDNKKVWKGQSIEISEGGAGIVVSTDSFHPGQRLFLHFKPGNEVPPFNATVEVVSKRELESGEHKGHVKYGVRFTNINMQTQKHLHEYTSKKVASAA